jgi:hypothetical protein
MQAKSLSGLVKAFKRLCTKLSITDASKIAERSGEG